MINFYEHLPKHLKTKCKIDKNTNMKIGSGHILMIGGTGAGKTNTLLNMIKEQQGVWDHITLITQNAEEPLYQYMKEKIDPEQFQIIENLADLKSPENLADMGTCLVIFDDQCHKSTKEQKKIIEYFIRARKIGCLKGGSVTCCYLSQSFYATPIDIRRNIIYLIIKQLAKKMDKKQIIKDYSMNISDDTLFNLVEHCCQDFGSFLMVDIGAPPDKKFRKGFTEIIDVKNI